MARPSPYLTDGIHSALIRNEETNILNLERVLHQHIELLRVVRAGQISTFTDTSPSLVDEAMALNFLLGYVPFVLRDKWTDKQMNTLWQVWTQLEKQLFGMRLKTSHRSSLASVSRALLGSSIHPVTPWHWTFAFSPSDLPQPNSFPKSQLPVSTCRFLARLQLVLDRIPPSHPQYAERLAKVVRQGPDCYKKLWFTPWENCPTLVGKRNVIVHGGYAYVPVTTLRDLLISKFKLPSFKCQWAAADDPSVVTRIRHCVLFVHQLLDLCGLPSPFKGVRINLPISTIEDSLNPALTTPCLQRLQKMALNPSPPHLRFQQRTLFTLCMITLGITAQALQQHWSAAWEHNYASRRHAIKSTQREVISMEGAIKRGSTCSHGASCLALISAHMCPFSGDIEDAANSVRTCKRTMGVNPDTPSFPVRISQQMRSVRRHTRIVT